MTRRWECTVCGYIHVGETPPETCPVCGADGSRFIALEESKAEPDPSRFPPLLTSLLTSFRLHPVAAHFPGGLIPTATLFLLLSVIFHHPGFEEAAFWLVMVTVAATPVSLASGLYDWQTHFAGARSPVFLKKIGLGMGLLSFGLVAVSLRHADPGLLTVWSWRGGLYLLCLLGMLGCVVLLGHYGASLVCRGTTQKNSASEG